MKIKQFIEKVKVYSSTKWNITDLLVRIKQIIPQQANPTDLEDLTVYTCFRNIEGVTVYIPTQYEDTFLHNSKFCSGKYNIINITSLQEYRVKRNIESNVYTRISPPEVRIKYTDYIVYNKVPIYIVYSIDLTYNDSLFVDLVNYDKIESKLS